MASVKELKETIEKAIIEFYENRAKEQKEAVKRILNNLK